MEHQNYSKCPECGSNTIINSAETGEVVCGGCGLVINRQSMDNGLEWRAYTFQENIYRSRVGAPVSILSADKGLSTSIDKVGRDAFGRDVTPQTRMKMLRLKRWQNLTRVQSADGRNLIQALADLDRMADKLHVAGVVQEDAANIYRKALEKDLVRGRSISALATASLYAACRKRSRPISLKDVASVSLLEKKDIAICYRLIIKELSLKMPVTRPKSYVAKIASKVKVSMEAQNKAIQLLNQAEKDREIFGKDPESLAAAALYIASISTGEWKSKKEISDATGVTEVTVRNRSKGLEKKARFKSEDSFRGE